MAKSVYERYIDDKSTSTEGFIDTNRQTVCAFIYNLLHTEEEVDILLSACWFFFSSSLSLLHIVVVVFFFFNQTKLQKCFVILI